MHALSRKWLYFHSIFLFLFYSSSVFRFLARSHLPLVSFYCAQQILGISYRQYIIHAEKKIKFVILNVVFVFFPLLLWHCGGGTEIKKECLCVCEKYRIMLTPQKRMDQNLTYFVLPHTNSIPSHHLFSPNALERTQHYPNPNKLCVLCIRIFFGCRACMCVCERAQSENGSFCIL